MQIIYTYSLLFYLFPVKNPFCFSLEVMHVWVHIVEWSPSWQSWTDGKSLSVPLTPLFLSTSPLLFCWSVCFWFPHNQEPLKLRAWMSPRQNMTVPIDDRDSMGPDPPGVLQGACSSWMPGMARGSQWHEPPTLNKSLAVVPGLDPVSS